MWQHNNRGLVRIHTHGIDVHQELIIIKQMNDYTDDRILKNLLNSTKAPLFILSLIIV